MAKSVEEIAAAMYKLVAEAQGMKKLKPTDLTKSMLQLYEGEVDKKMCKAAIKELINSGQCIYTYWGGSYIELPQEGGPTKDE
jgi:hypothetical protein